MQTRRSHRILLTLTTVTLTAALAAVAGPARAADPDVERPTPPGDLVVSNLTTNSMTLTWTPSTDNVGVTGYIVSKVDTDMVFSLPTPTNSIALTGLLPSRTYGFSVRAVDAAGNSSNGSSFLRLTMPPGDSQPPTVPGTPVASTVSDTSLTLSWGRSTDNVLLGAYLIYRIAGGVPTLVTTVPQIPGGFTSWRIAGLTPATTYTFAVAARDDAGNVSALSGTVTVTTAAFPDTTPPAAPGTPVVSGISPLGVTLTWTPSTDNVGVQDYQVINIAVPGTAVVMGSTTGTSIILGSLAPSQLYIFVIVARDAAGNRSAQSGSVNVAVAPACTVTYRVMSQWAGNFHAIVTIRNDTPTGINGWTLRWTFPNGQTIVNIWQTGPVTATGAQVTIPNAGSNATIAPGGTAEFGFIGSWNGANNPPVGYTLNGRLCAPGPI